MQIVDFAVCILIVFDFLKLTSKRISEADVHTATPSLGNAAATWAGWAVTAVAAKFYRSQSDTGRPQRPQLTGKAKPASLGMLEHSFNEHTKNKPRVFIVLSHYTN